MSSIEDWNRNAYYKSEEEYLFALADAIGEEYRAIVDAGFVVQVDDPHLVTYYVCHPDKTMEECRKWIALRVDAINHALRGIPKDRVRFHTCYGINFGPRVHDIEAKYIIDILGRLHAGAFSFEAANPRHEHEWTVWRDAKLPDDVIMIPGMITQSNVMVEHPELVAQRLGRWVDAFGMRTRHRRHRLRLRQLRRQRRDPRKHRLGEVRRAGRRRAHRVEADGAGLSKPPTITNTEQGNGSPMPAARILTTTVGSYPVPGLAGGAAVRAGAHRCDPRRHRHAGDRPASIWSATANSIASTSIIPRPTA